MMQMSRAYSVLVEFNLCKIVAEFSLIVIVCNVQLIVCLLYLTRKWSPSVRSYIKKDTPAKWREKTALSTKELESDKGLHPS